ncbi:MAG: DUF362 domain-containing protein [Sedimentisphaerales bacterium]
MITFFSGKKRLPSGCPKAAGRAKHRWLFWLPSITGFAALIWFLIRVIPKPSRATYPCQRVAFPLASGFTIWLMGLAGSVVAFRKARRYFLRARYIVGIMFVSFSISFIWMAMSHTTPKIVLADSQPVNEPMGTAQGIFPGRVVWVHDANATNENCSNTYTPVEDGWFLPKNNNQAVIDKMVSQMIRSLTGENLDEDAWDALFKNFNRTKGKGNAGYIPGQKIMIKANFTSAWGWGSDYPNIDSNDYSIVKNSWYGTAETSPEVVLAFLRQLVNVYGVRQQDISVGDPLKHLYKHTYDLLHKEFPNVVYIDHQSRKMGRTPIVPSAAPVIFYSDHGTILHEDGSSTPVYSDYLPTCITEANYMINIAALKGHARAGITLCAKNHFGSHCREDASHLHEGLVNPDSGTSPTRTGMGLYRVQVDLMGHKFLGGNTVLNVVDGLWGAPESIEKPEKWITAPFNNNYTSSIFASQDQVALESVCFDFLKTEYTQANHPDNYWPQMAGVDDYLHQAADPNNWPADINYDPENDGTLIGSLGVHEHWNDANNKQYTRNLDPVNGKGIELVNPTLDHYWVSITNCTVSTGKNNIGDISISGKMDVNANDLNDVKSFTITVDSNYMLSPCTKIFPVDGNSFKKGKYGYALTESGSKKSFKYDTKTGKFSFAAKNIDLSGLSCPVTMRITIGDSSGAGHASERIVNGRKPVPIKLMLGVKNTLRIDNFKVTKGKNKLSVKAAVAVEHTNVNLADVNVAITLDSQTFTILAGGFVAKKNKFVCTNADVNEVGLATGVFDANNCSFTVTIKQTSITSPSGYVNLGIKFADFNESGLVYLP